MKYDDLKTIDLNDLRQGISIADFSEHDNICTFKGMIPMSLDAVSFSYKSDQDIEIFDERGNHLGILCICKSIDNMNVNIESITDARFIAFINEVESEYYRSPFKFTKNYLVIDVCEYGDYKNKYMDGASIWGGFFHSSPTSSLQKAYQFQPTKLIARPNITLQTSYHKESSMRSVVQPYAFERFLKLYHLLELIFDWDLVQRIKGLNDDLQGIGKLLSEYSSTKEINFLKNLLLSRYGQGKLKINEIAVCLNQINSQPDLLDKGIEIFFDYGKETNPYKEDKSQFRNLMVNGGFSMANARNSSIKGIKEESYEVLVINFTAYCIYRVRCCIAHNRIGEYVMFSDDEGFVVEFAEPLLREVLCQIFSE